MAEETGRDIIAVVIAVAIACLIATWIGLFDDPPRAAPPSQLGEGPARQLNNVPGPNLPLAAWRTTP